MTSAIQTPNTPSAPPVGKVLFPIFLIVFTDIMGFGLMIPLLPFYAEHFGASAFTVGLLLSVFALCQLLAGPPLGQLSDRIGRKPVLVISQIGTLAGYILLALSNTLWLIFLARIIDGLTVAFGIIWRSVSELYGVRSLTCENWAKCLRKLGSLRCHGFG
jgi:MFS family permease